MKLLKKILVTALFVLGFNSYNPSAQAECGDITIVIPLEKSNLSFPLPFDIAILFRLCNFRIPKPFWVTSF